MYLCSLQFTIISGDGEIQKILSEAVPPEDCEFSFVTAAGITSGTGDPKEDSCVIIDGGEGILENIGGLGAKHTAFIVSADRLGSIDKGLLANAEAVWVMPSDNVHDPVMLKMYFDRLAAVMKESFDHRRLKICMETAIDSVPDLVWFKDVIGSHLIVNNGFCSAVEKTKEQIYKKGHYYIWDIPKEEYEQGDYVCLESEDIVINARKTVLFDEKVKTKSGMQLFKTYKSPLIDTDGTIFGTCGIAKDVTDLHNVNNELQVVIESMPFAVTIEDENDSVISVNSKFGEYFPESNGKDMVKWKKTLLEKAYINENGETEITVSRSDGQSIITFREEPIYDVFHERIGRVNIFVDVTFEYAMKQQTIRTANTDFLTSLNNRRSLFAHLDKTKNAGQLAIITVDLDNFKKVNDKYGHKTGDEALIETSRLLRAGFREDFIARTGGDEFLIVIDRPCSVEDLAAQTDRFLNKLKDFCEQNKEFEIMSASAGIALEKLPESGSHDIEALVHKSDTALYNVKNSCKGGYCVYKEG